MSCCTIKKEVASAIKELDLLRKHFDIVEVEERDNHTLLTLKDKTSKPNYDYIAWLQVKVAHKDGNRNSKSSQEKLAGACKSILDWVDILKNFEKSDSGKQLSLFGEEEEEGLEPEPESPQNGEDGSWGKYFRECERIRKNNLMKQYSFFELFDSVGSWWAYKEHDFTSLLPKSNQEMIELAKDAIVKGVSSEKGYGRFDDYWWDDEYNYVCRDGALSDIELFNRVMCQLRLYLVPYKRYSKVWTDDSFSSSEHEEKIGYRYWFDGGKVNHSSWGAGELPSYDLYDADFILWMREFFDVPYKEVISDEDILKENLKCLFKRVFNEYSESFDAIDEINKAKNFKEFKTRALSHANLGNGGGSGYSIDGFSASYSLDKGRKGDVLTIEQKIEQRLDLNRSIESLESGYREDSVYVYKLNFDEALEKAYELFKKETVKQTSLFDFMAA